MNLKSILLGTLITATPLLAIAKPILPNRCPSVEAIKSVPVDKATGDWVFGALAYTSEKQKYDTLDDWLMVVVVGKDAESEPEAIVKGNEKLALTTQLVGQEKSGDGFYCFYAYGEGRDDQGVGWAVSGPFEELNARFAFMNKKHKRS